MDGGSITSIVVLALLILMSAYFSASETAFSTFNRIRMKNLAEGGNKRAASALRLSEDYNTLLSTILVGNNIVNIAATSIATVLFVKHWGDAGPTLSTIVMTVVVLIFGEVTPKNLAKESPETFAMFSAPILRVITVILTPINFFFRMWKKLLSRLFKSSTGPSITEEELMTLVDEAEQEGAIDEEDRTLIQNVMEFNDSRVSEILTPRVDIVALPMGSTQAEATQLFLETGYTRLLVYQDSLDQVLGVIHLRDYFEALQRGIKDIEELLSPVVFITPYAKISDVLKILQSEKAHMAVVTDEYGGTVGLVTMEDILEELVGEIWYEHDEVVEEIHQNDDGSCLVTGAAYVDDVFEMLGITGESDASTVNGWIMEQLGHIPQQGDRFAFGGYEIEVLGVQNKRVTQCLFTRQEAPEPAQEEVPPEA